MPEFKKSDGFQMKRGTKPNFKDLGSSPTKFNWGGLAGLAAGGSTPGGLGGAGGLGGGLGGGIIGAGIGRRANATLSGEKKFADVLESEGLTRNFWGKLGFGGRRSRERKQRIKELQAQEQQGIDRDRIEANTGAPVAGPGAA